MGIEVSQDEAVTLGSQQSVQGRGKVRGAGGGRGNVYVVNVQGGIVDGGCDGKVFGGSVVGEE